MGVWQAIRLVRGLADVGASGAATGSERRRRARRYNREKNRLQFVGLGVNLVLGALFVFSGTAVWLRERVQQRTGRGRGSVPLTAMFFALLGWLVSLPLSFYSSFVVEHRFDLSNQTRRAWLGDQLKGLGVGLALQAPVASAVYAVIRRWPHRWWAILSGLSIPVTVIMAQLFPVLILPLFNKFEPLRDEALAERLKRLAAASGIEVADVLQMDMSRQTRKANAFFAGIGRTKRIVLADTLLENFTPEEIEVVVAHEIAHQAHRDLWRMIALGSLATFGVSALVDRLARATLRRAGARIGTRRLDDVATLPLLTWLLGLLNLGLAPLQNAYSRRIERRADEFALRLTNDPLAFGGAMSRLAEMNLDDPHPPAWIRFLMYSHPPTYERIEHARTFARERALPEPAPLERD